MKSEIVLGKFLAPGAMMIGLAFAIPLFAERISQIDAVQKLNDAHRMNVENLKAINTALDARFGSWDGGSTADEAVAWNGGYSFRVSGTETFSIDKAHRGYVGPSIASICLDAPGCKTVIVRTPDGGWDIPKRKRERRTDQGGGYFDGYFYNRGEPPQPAQGLPGDVRR